MAVLAGGKAELFKRKGMNAAWALGSEFGVPRSRGLDGARTEGGISNGPSRGAETGRYVGVGAGSVFSTHVSLHIRAQWLVFVPGMEEI